MFFFNIVYPSVNKMYRFHVRIRNNDDDNNIVNNGHHFVLIRGMSKLITYVKRVFINFIIFLYFSNATVNIFALN